MQVQQVFLADYVEIEELVKEHFQFPEYELMAEEECGSSQWNAWLRIDVEAEHSLIADALYNLPDMMNELCHRGVIPSGTYFIEVTW